MKKAFAYGLALTVIVSFVWSTNKENDELSEKISILESEKSSTEELVKRKDDELMEKDAVIDREKEMARRRVIAREEKLTEEFLRKSYFAIDSVIIRESYDSENELNETASYLIRNKDNAEARYSAYRETGRDDSVIKSVYGSLVKTFDTKMETIKSKRTELRKVRELGFGVVKNEKAKPRKQAYNENTCVFNSMAFAFEKMYGKKLSQRKVYSAIGKRTGEFWQSGIFVNEPDVGGNWIEMEGTQSADFESDYAKLARFGILSISTSSPKYLTERLGRGEVAVFEGPMSMFDDAEIWKTEKKNVWHAVAVISYDGKRYGTIADSLTGTKKTFDFGEITYGPENDRKFKYPFRFLVFDNGTFAEKGKSLFD